jgi:hypothetical protein
MLVYLTFARTNIQWVTWSDNMLRNMIFSVESGKISCSLHVLLCL